MVINTIYFGEVEVDENKIIVFDEGLLGFPELKRYLFMEDEGESPFCWLQSIDDKDVVFPIMDVSNYIADYEPVVDSEELERLGEAADDELMVYTIAVIPDNIEDLRVNLKAPVVINLNTLKAKQFVSNNDNYPIKYFIYKEIMKNKAGEQ